jgi:hypothetical protein
MRASLVDQRSLRSVQASFRAQALCAALPLLVAVASAAGGCSKDKESLVIVALTSLDPSAAATRTLTLSVASVTTTFPLSSAGLSQTAISFGVYIPSSATGDLQVSANAKGSGLCFSGSTTATVGSAGSTVTVPLALTATTVGCT